MTLDPFEWGSFGGSPFGDAFERFFGGRTPTRRVQQVNLSQLLNEQARDQHRLREQDRQRADEVALITIPEGRVSKKNSRSRGDMRFADAPTLELTPVHLIDVDVERRDGNVVGARALPVRGDIKGAIDRIRAVDCRPLSHVADWPEPGCSSVTP